MPHSAPPPPDVPDQLRAEFRQIADRAAGAGRPLRPVPTLEVAAHAQHGSRVIFGPPGGADPPRVRLSLDLLGTPPADRAWTIAHELSHVLRGQEGARPSGNAGLLVVAAASGALSIAAVLAGAYSELFGNGRYALPLGLLAVAGVAGLWLVLNALLRREETATDATAARVFGEVLTVAGVERIRRDEGALSRYVPTVLRTHPDPAARRRAGLASRPDVDR